MLINVDEILKMRCINRCEISYITDRFCEVSNEGHTMALTSHFSACLLVLILQSQASTIYSAVVGSEPRSLHKRGLESLCILVTSMTSRNCWDFADYGCTCGLKGQSDLVPVDSVDRCCLDRLKCYQQLNCYTPFFIDSGVICTQNGCSCTDTDTGSCEYQTCQCDLQFGLCLSSRGTFNGTYENYDRANCKHV